jgi:hypothetical protein
LARAFAVLLPQCPVQFSACSDFDATFSEEFDFPKSLLAKVGKSFEVELFLQTLLLSWMVKTK